MTNEIIMTMSQCLEVTNMLSIDAYDENVQINWHINVSISSENTFFDVTDETLVSMLSWNRSWEVTTNFLSQKATVIHYWAYFFTKASYRIVTTSYTHKPCCVLWRRVRILMEYVQCTYSKWFLLTVNETDDKKSTKWSFFTKMRQLLM